MQLIDRIQFTTWLEGLKPSTTLGFPGGTLQHPIVFFLERCHGGHWHRATLYRQSDFVFMKSDGDPFVHHQAGWLLAFCRALMPPDAWRTVTAADCLAVLAAIP